MKITFNRKGNIAYIYLTWPLAPKAITKTYLCDPHEAGAEINLDFDNKGKLVGIEVINALRHLPEELIKEAEVTD